MVAVVLTVFAAGLVARAHDAPAAAIAVDAQRQGDTIEIRASAVLHADATSAWRVLTDYERYVDFIPDLHTSRILARNGALVTVEQSGDASLWMLKVPVDVTFEVTESPPDRLSSRAIAGSLRAVSSSYLLTSGAAGLRLDYSGRIAPGFELFGRIEQAVVRRNVSRQFQALVDEIERRSAAAVRSATGAAPRE